MLALATLVATPGLASAADSAYTFTEQKFDEATFPGANWSTTGSWSKQCDPAPPGGGCSAVATTNSTDYTESDLTFKPSTVLPADLQNVTLTFTEAADLDGQNDSLHVYATPASATGQGDDLRYLFDADDPDGDGTKLTTTPTTYSVPIQDGALTFPLIFRWQTWGEATGATRSWSISDVKITGTLPATDYALTADPIPNTAYPYMTAGQTRTVTLSGSSDPVGDTLNFAITSQPSIGSFGAVTAVDSTHAKVTYTTGATDCPDPAGTPGVLCTASFQYTASDAQGHVSAPASGVIDVHPGGAGGLPVSINAPPSTTYSTVIQNQTPTQAADLSGVVQLGPSTYPDEVEVHLRASAGTLNLMNADNAGITYVNGTSNNQTQVQFKGPIKKVNAALGMFLYLPPTGTTPDATVDIYAADLGATGQGGFLNPAHQVITVKALTNTPRPILTMPTGTLSIATGSGPLSFPAGAATGIGITDGGATDSTNDTVRLGVSDGKLALPAADTTGPAPLVTVSNDGGMFSITGTVAHLTTALTQLTFDPTGVVTSSVDLTGFVYNPDSGLTSKNAATTITVVQGPSLYGTTTVGTLMDVPLTVFLCGRGPSGAQLSYAVTSGPTHGTFVADPSASAVTSGCSVNPGTLVKGYTYTPADGYIGADQLDYTITDATTGLSAKSTVDITVTAHRTPTADSAAASTRQDSPVTVTVCALNPDPQPRTLAFELTSQPTNGTVTPKGIPALNPCDNPNQTPYAYLYTPAAGAFTTDGTDSFSYRVSNGAVSQNATVTIAVATRTPDIAVQPLSVNENGSLEIHLCSTEPNGPVTFTVGNPSNGILDDGTAAANGPTCPDDHYGVKSLRYVPKPNFSGVDVITARVTDGAYTSTTVTMPIVVNFVEVPATADDKNITVLAGHSAPVTLTGSSVHGLPLTFRVVDGPSHGSLSGTAPNLVYTPSISEGTDSFRYLANDGKADGAPATVQLRVTTPSLSSSVCLPGTTEIHPDQFACVGTLTTGPGGVALAPTNGTRGSQLRLQTQITNHSAAADDVTLTGTPSLTGTTAGTWNVLYDVAGNDDTGDLTGSGLSVHLEPGASVFVVAFVFAPFGFEGPSSFGVTVRAVSTNGASVSTAQSVRVTDGASTPTLGATQADGTGAVSWPTWLAVSPMLYVGGPAGSAKVVPAISGTGHNSYTVRAEVQSNSTSDAAMTIKRANQDVTKAVLAGTFPLECYSDIGCPPLTVTFAPGQSGGLSDVLFTMTSTIDGRAAYAEVTAYVAATVGPDLYTTPPRTGYGLIEATPDTQVISAPVQVGNIATQRVILRSVGTVTDTFSLRGTATGTGTVTYTATPPTSDGSGTAVDVTTAVRNGSYRVTLAGGQEALIYVTVAAADSTSSGSSDADAADVVLTAASQLAKDHVDAYSVRFPVYSYRPDVLLTGPDGATIGSGVYDTGTGRTESGFFPTSLAPRTIKVNFADHGSGPQPRPDSLVVKAPGSSADFVVTYQLQNGSTLTDVTKQVTGDGLTISLADGGPTLLMSAASDYTARAGRPGYFTISATSVASGLSDAVQAQLYTQGASQLRFAGLPQPEPADTAARVRRFGLTRIAPFPSVGYAPGVTYGAYPDPTGQKFVYDSTYDSFDLQIFAQNAVATRQSLRFSAPATGSTDLPDWADTIYRFPYTNQGQSMLPADPLAADGVHPKITVNGDDVTAAVLAGTWSTGTMRTNETLNVHVSFDPAAGDSRRYSPLRVALVDTDTATTEDVLNLGLSSIIECTDAGIGQQHVTSAAGKLNFRSYDRSNSGAGCLQPLTSNWITRLPLVFSSDDNDSDSPKGLWLLPQGGTVLRVDNQTLAVTGASVKAYVDSVLLGPDGKPDPSSYRLYNYLGTYSDLNWQTQSNTTGLAVTDDTVLPRSPFPMVTPNQFSGSGNALQARRYFQIQPATGAPAMVGTMRVNEPWFHGDIDLNMPVDSVTGLVLDYSAPADTKATLPGDDSTTTYGFYWTSRTDGSITQGGCLGLPPAFFNLIGVNTSVCIIGVTTTFKPIPSDPTVEAKIADITFTLMVVGVEIGEPTFNVQGLDGHIELDPATGSVTQVVASVSFGVGPVTPCYAEQKARAAEAVVSTGRKVAELFCPTNYFIFKAQVTFQHGGFTSANSTTGYGIKFLGTLSFLGLVQLNSVEADVSTQPFNFHFADSPIDLSVNAGIPIAARITLSGDVGALGFDIGIEGNISVMNQSIASASGVVSTKGMGICGGLAGVSVGFGQPWTGSPTFYSSGCSTDQFRVTS